jgi:hypothetical protein
VEVAVRIKSRRMLRVLTVLAGVTFLMLLAISTILLFELASPTVFRDRVQTAQTRPEPASTPDLPMEDRQPSPGGATNTPSSTPEATPGDQSVTAYPVDTASDPVLFYLIERYIQREATEVRVCFNLNRIPTRPPANPSELRGMLSAFAVRNTPNDPYVESLLPPVGYFVRLPSVNAAIQRILAFRTTGDATYVEAPVFPSQLALAAAETVRNRPILDRMAQRSYHLFVLTRAVQIQPLLANDARTLELCDAIAGAIERDFLVVNPDLQNTDTQLLNEKAALLRYLGDVGLAPNQVGYDFNLTNQVRASINGERIELSIPWMQRTFGTGFKIVNPVGSTIDSSADEP